jgi:hypothetical protein
MRLVLLTSPGVLELNYMWLPTWLGMNAATKAAVESELKSKVAGLPATEDNLDTINDALLELLTERFPIAGLRDYLDGLKFVRV